MAKFYERLTPALQEFIAQQQIFFVASAPTNGRVNLSPKGIDSFRCLNDQAIAYLDLTGSGNETAAHLLENPRLTIMFCSFSAVPQILRLYGQGQAIHPRDRPWQELAPLFPDLPGARQIISMQINSVQTSCGFGVPTYEFSAHRSTLIEWADQKGASAVQAYQRQKNQQSIDGLPTGLFAPE